jgi:hypothetical protein
MIKLMLADYCSNRSAFRSSVIARGVPALPFNQPPVSYVVRVHVNSPLGADEYSMETRGFSPGYKQAGGR